MERRECAFCGREMVENSCPTCGYKIGERVEEKPKGKKKKDG